MDGIINVLKPPGLTSRQVVSMIKGITRIKKVGHAGTLDPGACGVLPVMVGKATRLFDYMGEGKKEYIAEFTFGTSTTTQDSYGDVVETGRVIITDDMLREAISGFVGECRQRPSIYSAVHINGKRAYDYAYEGKDVELPERTVNIFEMELIDRTGENSYLVRVLCSKGCYIRSLCEDVAKKMCTNGYVSVLLRTKTGMFNIEDSYTIDELQAFTPDKVTSVDSVLGDLQELHIKRELDFALHNGNKLPLEGFDKTPIMDVAYRVFDSCGYLCALGMVDEDIFRIKIMLREVT